MGTRTCLEITREGDTAIASFTGSYICDTAETANAFVQLSEYLEANPPRRMIFDFAGVAFVSSQVLSLLLGTRTRLEPHQSEVVIASLSPQLQRVFVIAHLDQTFRFFPDRATATKAPGITK